MSLFIAYNRFAVPSVSLSLSFSLFLSREEYHSYRRKAHAHDNHTYPHRYGSESERHQRKNHVSVFSSSLRHSSRAYRFRFNHKFLSLYIQGNRNQRLVFIDIEAFLYFDWEEWCCVGLRELLCLLPSRLSVCLTMKQQSFHFFLRMHIQYISLYIFHLDTKSIERNRTYYLQRTNIHTMWSISNDVLSSCVVSSTLD